MSSRVLPVVSLLVVHASVSSAETAVRLETCREAESALRGFTFCKIVGGVCLPPKTSKCWDFEEGTLGDSYFGDWSVLTNGDMYKAFQTQPTYGDNVRLDRVQYSDASALRNQLDGVGGDYWNTPYPVGHQGDWWIGTYEKRPSKVSAWGGTQGDVPYGSIESPPFVVDRNYLHFLIGGGCNASRVYLRVLVKTYITVRGLPTEQWMQAVDVTRGTTLKATGACSELMERKVFFTDAASGLQGKTVKIEVRDWGSQGWDHLNVDHILHTNASPDDLAGKNQPVWGFADLHTHPASERAFRSLDSDGHVAHGGPNGLGGYDVSSVNDPGMELSTSTEANTMMMTMGNCGHGADHPGAHGLLDKLGGASLGLDYHRAGGYQGPGYDNFAGWPYWWTRAHQQMHVTWLRRAYEGGLRLMVASQHNNELMAEMMRDDSSHAYLSDYGSLRRFALFMQHYAAANHTWMELALSPSHARSIIRQNKLAVILAAEVDNLGDHCSGHFSFADSEPQDKAYSKSTCENCNPWPVIADTSKADRCDTAAEWATRIDDLYQVGYRLITPVHLADNGLGGSAAYSNLFNVANKYLNDSYFQVAGSSAVSFTYTENVLKPVWCEFVGCGDTDTGTNVLNGIFGIFLASAFLDSIPGPGERTPALQGLDGPENYSDYTGHLNSKGLTAMGATVLGEMKRRGMLVDVTHMSKRARAKVLGLVDPLSGQNLKSDSVVAPGCDLTSASCWRNAYPVLSSHAALGGNRAVLENEAQLTHSEVLRIAAIGGMVGPGTGGAADVPDADELLSQSSLEFMYGPDVPDLYASHVPNDCAGSSKSFAQSYLYALRAMGGKGVAISTDFGLEGQANPRFGATGCFARGNIVKAVGYSPYGHELFSKSMSVGGLPHKFRYDLGDSAGHQRALQRDGSAGLRYAHYGNVVPSGGAYYQGLWDTATYLANLAQLQQTPYDYYATPTAMNALASHPAMTANALGGRKFDLNFDGLAHYGLLPDFFEDLHVDGVTAEQLGVAFRSAEDFVRTWEKSCRLSDSTVSTIGCWEW